jgi:ubiquinone/menaquinone biosynthesis C-methylase UbiE
MDAIASLGREVVGVDVRPARLEIASIFLDPRRTHIVRASIEALPFRDDAFSNIICYGVIMFADAETALSEFSRVSRSRCKLYLCWNAVGWSLNLILTHHDLRVMMQGVITILNTWMKRSGTKYFSAKAMGHLLKRAGFRVLAEDGEGSISGEPIYSRTFLGFENVLEALTERP